MAENSSDEIRQVASESDIPRGPKILTFNPGHTRSLRTAGLVGDDSLYVVTDKSGSSDPYSSISVESLMQNKVLTENRDVPLATSDFSAEGVKTNIRIGETEKANFLKDQELRISAQELLYQTLHNELTTQDPKPSLQILLDGINNNTPPENNPNYALKRVKKLTDPDKIRAHYEKAQATNNILANLPGPESEDKMKARKLVEEILMRDENGDILDAKLKVEAIQGLADKIRGKFPPQP